MFGFLKRLFGTKAERNIKRLKPYVKKINTLYATLAKLSHDELRAETDKLRAFLASKTDTITQEITALQTQVADTGELREKLKLNEKISQLEEKQARITERALHEMLPQAFAIVKETARRFKENTTITVKANDFDKKIAEKYDYVALVDGTAQWANTWEVEGQKITWDMVHYDVQLMGGIVLHQGKIAEMLTGEGKTLVATLPAFLNALTKKGVHIITVNDYLAKRDAAWMRPIFQFHGISVSCIEGTPVQSPQRRESYNADITYGTNNGFGFDYLYDNIAKKVSQQVQRGHYYGIGDEIDYVLIDDANTPLIVSGAAQKTENHKIYRALKPRIRYIYQLQEQLVRQLLKEAKEKIAEKNKKEGGLALFRAYRGLPTYWPLIAYLSEKGVKKILSSVEDYYLQENGKLMPEADEPLFFTIDKKSNTIDLTDKGIEYLTQKDEGKDFFVLPDIGTEMATITKDKSLTDEEKIELKNKKLSEFTQRSARIHATNQLLRAYALYHKNREYVVMDNQVKIVDEKTGRILKGRRYSNGLHQALEAKEDVTIEKSSQVYATISPSNQFRMYRKLAGMTGTAATEATEMMEIYHLEVVSIPPNKPVIRKDHQDHLYKTEREKLDAIVSLVAEIKAKHRPILLITPSVEVSERIRKRLNVPPTKVLNAKNHHLEAQIIAKAGELDTITIATQMAARGTDIKVPPAAEEVGGLFVIIVEKHETRRVDNQARGRAGRQGQPGDSVCFLSLEDPLIVHWKHGALGKQVDRVWSKEGEVLIDKMIAGLITNVQRTKEQNHFFARKRTLEYDNVMEKQRNAIYERRNHALRRESLQVDNMYAIYSSIYDLITQKTRKTEEKIHLSLVELLHLTKETIIEATKHQTPRKAANNLYKKVVAQLEEREAQLAKQLCEELSKLENMTNIVLPIQCGETLLPVPLNIPEVVESKGKKGIATIQSEITLAVIDKFWTSHLQAMNELKDSVRNAVYENKDPILVYKFESVNIFKELINNINTLITQYLLTFKVAIDKIVLEKAGFVPVEAQQLLASKDDGKDNYVQSPQKPIVIQREIGRNDRVSVRYTDGTVKKDVKYKTVEADIIAKNCTLIT